MCCSAACAFHPVVLSLNQNSSSAHPLLPCCRPIINHCRPIWHPRRGPQAVLSRFSTNPGWSHRPELQLSTFPTCTHAPVPAYQPHPKPRQRLQQPQQPRKPAQLARLPRPMPPANPPITAVQLSSSASPQLLASFSFNQHISSWQELAHKPTHQSSSHMTKRAMLVA